MEIGEQLNFVSISVSIVIANTPFRTAEDQLPLPLLHVLAVSGHQLVVFTIIRIEKKEKKKVNAKCSQMCVALNINTGMD
jgi:hypothetical protein